MHVRSSRPNSAFLTVILLLTALLAPPAVAADVTGGGENATPLFESGNLRAHIGLRRGGVWCSTQMQVILYLKSDAVLAGDQAELNAFLEKLPGLLRAECDKVRSAQVSGMLDDKRVYRGVVSNIHRDKPRIRGQITDRSITEKYRPAVRPGDVQQGRRGRGELVPRGATATTQAPEPPDGTLFKVATLGEQCQVLMAWTGRLEAEYGDDKQTTFQPEASFSRTANLFADAHFEPVFGTPYDGMDEDTGELVVRHILSFCPRDYQQRRRVRFLYNVAFRRGQGDFNPASLAALVKERRADRAWMAEEADGLDAVPATAEGLARLRLLADEAAQRAAELWPSEGRAFLAQVGARRSAISVAVARARIAGLPAEQPSLNALDAILAETRRDAVAADAAKLADLEAAAAGRRGEIRTALVDTATADLAKVPATVAGLGELRSRRERLRAAVGAKPPLPAMDAYDKAWAARAQAVVDGALAEFRASLDALPATLDGADLAGSRLIDVAAQVRAVAPARVAAFEQAARGAETRIRDGLITAAVARVEAAKGTGAPRRR